MSGGFFLSCCHGISDLAVDAAPCRLDRHQDTQQVTSSFLGGPDNLRHTRQKLDWKEDKNVCTLNTV